MNWLVVSACSGFLAVALGAFGAHGLKDYLTPKLLEIYHTAVFYHFVHTLVLLGIGFYQIGRPPLFNKSAWLFLSGLFVFSGSLYGLSLTGLTILGAITPVGGLLLLAGWASLAWKARQINQGS